MRLIYSLSCWLLLGMAATVPASAADGGGIVYGHGVSVGIAAPNGWVFDSQSGVAQGLHAVIYPAGSSWSAAPAVMYVNLAPLGSGETLDSFIAGDMASFKARAAALTVATAAPIALKDGKLAQVRHFAGGASAPVEAIAYTSLGSTVVIYVLSCRDQEAFVRSRPAFDALVSDSFLARMAPGTGAPAAPVAPGKP